VGFLGGCTQKNPPGFFGYVPGCLNPAIIRTLTSEAPALITCYVSGLLILFFTLILCNWLKKWGTIRTRNKQCVYFGCCFLV